MLHGQYAREHRRRERIYVAGCEIYREFSPDGEVILERHELHVADGGQVRLPLTRTFFSPRFGMLSDRFGVGWLVYVAA